jgi:hypothetical protein
MEDDELVEHVARDFIERYGTGVAEVLREHAERCKADRDRPSAQAWVDIADAAERQKDGGAPILYARCRSRASTTLP